jgi:hypothetical protein
MLFMCVYLCRHAALPPVCSFASGTYLWQPEIREVSPNSLATIPGAQGENCNGQFLCRWVTYAPAIFCVLNLVVA